MRLAAIAEQLFDEDGFAGNRAHYDDFRNSFLNVVLERRLGIPITLALVFIEVAQARRRRRAGRRLSRPLPASRRRTTTAAIGR